MAQFIIFLQLSYTNILYWTLNYIAAIFISCRILGKASHLCNILQYSYIYSTYTDIFEMNFK